MRSLCLPTIPLPDPLPTGWDQLSIGTRRRLREALIGNQDKLCAWCQTKVAIDDSHIDHIRMRSGHPQLTFHPANLLASCGRVAGQTCGHARGQQGDLPEWVHPYETVDLECYYHYDIDGGMRPSPCLTDSSELEEANESIAMLNLNDRTLKERRETHLTHLGMYCEQGFTREEILQFLSEFPSLTNQQIAS